MTERNAIDGQSNAPHSTSLDNFGYHSNVSGMTSSAAASVSNQSSVASSPQKALSGGGNHVPSSNSYPNSFSVAAGANRTVSPGSTLSSPGGGGAVLSPGGGSVFSAHSSANSSYTTPQQKHKYLSSQQPGTAPSSGQNSLHSSMTSFHHTPARSTLPTDYKQPNGYSTPSAGGGGDGLARTGWPPVRHTPSPAPSLPAPNISRSESRNSHAYESASLDRKDRKSAAYDARTDYSLRFSQTLGGGGTAMESRSLRRSKRGRAATPTLTSPSVEAPARRDNDE